MKFYLMTQGGYGKIYKEPTRTTICKRMPKRDQHRIDLYSTIVELGVTSSIQSIQGTPRARSIELTHNSALIYMHHHGEPLNKWLDKLHPAMRPVDGPRVLRSVIFTLLHLLSVGILHTDLKPCNILVKNDCMTTLIDYNCVSVVGIEYDFDDAQRPSAYAALSGGHPARVVYTASVGTFSFLAPELVFTGRPTPTSCVWSLALLALLIYANEYPIPEAITHDADRQWYNTQKEWKQIHRTLQSSGSPVLAIPKYALEAFGNDYQVLTWVQQALSWEPLARPTLPDIAKIMMGGSLPAYPLPAIEAIADPTLVPRDLRVVMIDRLYNIAIDTKRQTWFSHAMYIFDVALLYVGRREHQRFTVSTSEEPPPTPAASAASTPAVPPPSGTSTHVTSTPVAATSVAPASSAPSSSLSENGFSVLAAACWVMSGCFHNEYVFDEPMHIESIRTYFKQTQGSVSTPISREHISQRMWMLGEALEWRIWARPLDVVLYEDYNIKLTFGQLRDVFVKIDRPWTPSVLAANIAFGETKRA